MRGATISITPSTDLLIFQSTHPLRGATRIIDKTDSPYLFQSTHPLRGATIIIDSSKTISNNFNPRTPCGVRLTPPFIMDAGDYFNPRTPCGVRLPCTAQEQLAWKFQSTHPLRGATIHVMQTKSPLFISIHAPLAGCDPPRRGDTQTRGISIHAPLAGCDRSSIRNSPPYRDFNPRTPCGVRPRVYSNTYRKSRISIHAPLAGCDGGKPAPRPRLNVFQSTHPLRGATQIFTFCDVFRAFQSTHPLRGATPLLWRAD